MRFWFDTEFMEDGKSIDLLSIGVVAEDGRTYYAEPKEVDLWLANDWVKANVLPHLTGKQTRRDKIAKELIEFMGDNPEIWAYYADYDWVALCQLFGRMIDLPTGWPMYCRDLKQVADDRGVRFQKQTTTEHHALNDALWARDMWISLHQ